MSKRHDPKRVSADLIELIMSLRSKGITERRLLSALETTPRELFVPVSLAEFAHDDRALPIECGQTISQPTVIATMLTHLNLDDRHKVLEVGSGSGYVTAILSQLCRRVYAIERYKTLMRQAEEKLLSLGITNVTFLLGDGTKGWAPQAPFERILVSAAAQTIPTMLADQLEEGGQMVIPIGPPNDKQMLVHVERQGKVFKEREIIPVRFVPLVEGTTRLL